MGAEMGNVVLGVAPRRSKGTEWSQIPAVALRGRRLYSIHCNKTI